MNTITADIINTITERQEAIYLYEAFWSIINNEENKELEIKLLKNYIRDPIHEYSINTGIPELGEISTFRDRNALISNNVLKYLQKKYGNQLPNHWDSCLDEDFRIVMSCSDEKELFHCYMTV